MTHQTWHLLMILGLPSLQDYKKQLSVVYQLVYGIYNSSRKRQGSLIVKKTGLFDSEGQRSLADHSLQGRKELDTPEAILLA